MTASVENKAVRLARIAYSLVFGFIWYYSPLNKFKKMKFMSYEKLVDEFNAGKSVARYGDGELRILERIPSNFYQKNNDKLVEELEKITLHKNKKLIVCMPLPLKSTKGLVFSTKLFWISNTYWNRKKWAKYIDLDYEYGNTQVTRPYIDYIDKESAKKRYENLRRIWDGKSICLIEGSKTHLGEGNDLFNNAKEIKRIIAPATNAFDHIDELLAKAKKVDKKFIFLIALGPAATVLASELAKHERRAFDVGHIDVEYEWMQSGTKKKIPISGKAVNESRK